MKKNKIKKNRGKCAACGDIIESKYRHDFVTCKCYKGGERGIFVDGGTDYLRRGGNLKDFIDLHEEE